MGLELLREKFGYSGVTKEVDNKEKIHERLNAEFNSSDIENLESFKSQDLLDLLTERFVNSVSTNKKEADNIEKINEK